MTEDNEDLAIHIEDVSRWHPPPGQTGHGVLLHTTRGDIHILVHNSADPEHRTTKAILYVWGAPWRIRRSRKRHLRQLAEELKDEITSIRIDYRLPNVHDRVRPRHNGRLVIPQRHRTHRRGARRPLIRRRGCHSRRPFSPMVKAVVALSSQIYGASNAGAVSPRPLLHVHGGGDTRLRRAAPSRSTIGPTSRRKWS